MQHINVLVEENRLSEAVAHCRHILNQFPRHVEAYRVYGKALLEQQKYDDAVDIFQRVLSADPEDFISHVGLAITHKERGEVAPAIWHFERAFEMEPYNGTIQEELRGLYANRDGLRPERITLTRGALARLYFRGNLYQQAAAELHQILSQNEKRLDLEALLAETLWRDDQKVDVVDVCLHILDQTPYCIKANAILAEVWLMTGRSDEAQEYLQRLRMLTSPEKAHLDPDSVVGRAFKTNGLFDLPEEVLIEELDYIPMAQELSGSADWVTEFGDSPERDEEAVWLDEIGQVDPDVFAQAATSDEDMLDWLREVAVSEGDSINNPEEGGATNIFNEIEGEELVEDSATESRLFDWLSEEEAPSEEPLGDVPDWLNEVTSSAEADMWNMSVQDSEGQSEEVADNAILPESAIARGETPDWIRDVSQENDAINPVVAWQEEDDEEYELGSGRVSGELTEEDEIPEWMHGGGADADDFPDWLNESDEALLSEAEELPNWLTNPEEETASEDEFPDLSVEDTVYGLTGEEIPDWLLGTEDEPTSETEPVSNEMFESDIETPFDTDFNSSSDENLEEPPETAVTISGSRADESLDWLNMDFGSSFDEESEESPESAVAEDSGEPEEPFDWLAPDSDSSLEEDFEKPFETPVTEVKSGAEESFDWLTTDLAANFDEDFEEPTETVVDEANTEFEEPFDWLTTEEKPSEAAETAVVEDISEAEDIPDWLKAEYSLEDEDTPVDSTMESAEIEDETNGAEAVAGVSDWLQDFEQSEQADEALPEWLEESPEFIVGKTDIDQDALPDWLEGDDQEELVREEILMGNSEEQDNKKPDIPEDLDEAMKWLEELAASQGADIAELPSLQKEESSEEKTAVEGDDVPNWLKDELSDGELSSEDDLPDWLKNEVASASDMDWMSLSGEDDLTDLDIVAHESEDSEPDNLEQSGDDLPDWLDAPLVEDQSQAANEPEDDNLSWLEQIAAGEGAPIEELPTLSWDEEQDDTILEGSDLSWLDEIVEEDVVSEEAVPDLEEMSDLEEVPDFEAMLDFEEMPDLEEVPDFESTLDFEEMPGLEEGPDFEEMPNLEEVPDFSEFMSEPVDEVSSEVPDDPDEAMAWLERLAAQQGTPLEELPTMTQYSEAESETESVEELDFSDMPTMMDLPESADFEEEMESSEFEVPDDPDEAMAWLERLAAQQGAPFEELPSIEVVDEMPTPVTGIVMESEESEVEAFEPVEAESLDFEPAEDESFDFEPVETESPDFDLEEVEPEAESEPEDDPELEMALAELSDIDMPGDDDEAMAWLAAITFGDTTAEAEEIPDISFEEEIPETVVGVTAEVEVPEPVAVEETPEEMSVAEFAEEETEAEEPEPDYEEPAEVSLFDDLESEADGFLDLEDDLTPEAEQELADEELASALPDWLQFGQLEDGSLEELGWLDSIGESDADSWLEAEEEITQLDQPVPAEVRELEPTAFLESDSWEEPEVTSEEAVDVEQFASGLVDQSRLDSARSSLESGDYSSAVDQYNSLIQSGEGLPLVIADLESAAASNTNLAPLHRLLGDAYMQNGQLQKAIDTYRKALDNL
ncbi:MAG: tetratricopeptide repeat protein [Candidatus Promineifilaceae bacterium]